MSHHDEVGLITRIIKDKDLRTVMKQRVTYKFFFDPTCREVFHWMTLRYQKFGRVPTMRLVRNNFPEFEPNKAQEDLTELIEEVKSAKLYADLSHSLKSIKESTTRDPVEGYQRLREMAGKLTLMHSNVEDVDLSKQTHDIWAEFDMARKGGGAVGIPYPWEYMNQVTLGMHPGELIGIYARSKSMKTWIALVIANHIHETTGKIPAFFSGEMPVVTIQKRLAALKAKLPYSSFRSGQLTVAETIRFRQALKTLREGKPFMICKIGGDGDAALTEIRAKCEEYQVDVAICDGFYFWMTDDSYRAFRVLTRGMKNMAEALRIPVVGITQANRGQEKDKGRSTVGVAFGDSLAQDCDQLISLVREPIHKEAREILVTMPAMREAEGGMFTINALPCTDFTQKMIMEGEMVGGGDSGDEVASIMG